MFADVAVSLERRAVAAEDWCAWMESYQDSSADLVRRGNITGQSCSDYFSEATKEAVEMLMRKHHSLTAILIWKMESI